MSAPGSASEEPIFVIGMPRSGTTLVDRILSSSSAVHSAGELQRIFGVVLKRASRSRTPELLDVDTVRSAASLYWRQLGDAYVASTRPATAGKPRFVDKLPQIFLDAGFIARALPNARIICLRRNPMDTCLGNFRQSVAQSTPYYDYLFDLLDTGRYYILFDRLMTHWRNTMRSSLDRLRVHRGGPGRHHVQVAGALRAGLGRSVHALQRQRSAGCDRQRGAGAAAAASRRPAKRLGSVTNRSWSSCKNAAGSGRRRRLNRAVARRACKKKPRPLAGFLMVSSTKAITCPCRNSTSLPRSTHGPAG